MKNLFEQFANGGGEVTSEGLNADFRLNLAGSTTITKGGLSYTLCFYAYLGNMAIKNAVSIEDFDVSDSYDYSFSGVPVDNMNNLRDTLNSSGLSAIAKSLAVEWTDERKAVAKEIEKDKLFKKIYGKGAFIWEALTEDEQKLLRLQHLIDNYETISVDNYLVREFMTEEDKRDEEGMVITQGEDKRPIKVRVKPTLESLKELYIELNNK